MKIAIIGTGYVGLPTGIGFAELGHEVVCIDRELSKIEHLRSGKTPLSEAGLDELLVKNLATNRLSFTTSMEEGVKDAQIVFVAVGTPKHPVSREADMKYVYAAATELADFIKNYTVIAIKSTVPVGICENVEELIQKKNKNADIDVVSLPEFLREGFAVHDFFNPDRIVVGTESERAIKVIKELYEPFKNKMPMLFAKRRSSEIIKYASNAFLALKIHYINEMANFCEKADVDVLEVAKGMGLDTRINSAFLNPGVGFGGSCFPKDTLALAHMARMNDVDLSLIETVIKENKNRRKMLSGRIIDAVKGIKNAQIAVLGLAFKGGTDDCRESPAIDIIYALTEAKLAVSVFDPAATENAKEQLGVSVQYATDMYSALKGADVLVILTEWQEFAELDLSKAAKLMKTKKILDFRNMLCPKKAKDAGFTYLGIGR